MDALTEMFVASLIPAVAFAIGVIFAAVALRIVDWFTDHEKGE